MEDEDRPSVLAQQRFAAERARLVALPLAERFVAIHDDNLWGAGTSVSGLGSEAEATAPLRRALPAVCAALGVRSVLDAPCGDAGWISRTILDGIDYVGVDIVPALIIANAARYGSFGRFALADITRDPLPRADAILCRDCLVHLSFANIAAALGNFRRSGATWLLTTTFPGWHENRDAEDGDWRALNLQRPPFTWAEPIRLLDEACTEGGGGWADKSVGVWRLADLPLS